MLIRLYWPAESKLKIKLKRAIFGDSWVQRKPNGSIISRRIEPIFNVRKIKRGIIYIKESEWPSLRDFLEKLGIRYDILKENWLVSGPKVLVNYGLNAFVNDFFKVLADDEMLKRANRKYVCLEDAIVTTFAKAIGDKLPWLGYVVMIFTYRKVDKEYLIKRSKIVGVYDQFVKFLGLIFRTFRGPWSTNRWLKIALSHPRFRHLVDYFNSIHWWNITSNVEEFMGLEPETIVSLAGKQILGY